MKTTTRRVLLGAILVGMLACTSAVAADPEVTTRAKTWDQTAREAAELEATALSFLTEAGAALSEAMELINNEQDQRAHAQVGKEKKQEQAGEMVRETRRPNVASAAPAAKLARVSPQTREEVDFTSEAEKSARIFGCNTSGLRVTGLDGQRILFVAECEGGHRLTLACDQAGLCLKKPERSE